MESAHILIADDEETFLESTADLLRERGYDCDCVRDGQSALDALEKDAYDLLIADIRMPGNPRLELIKDLDGVAVGMPTILVTAYPSTESAIESLRLPVMGYLVKPFEFEELLGQVETSIERYRNYRSVRDLRTRLRDWSGDLERIEENLVDPPRAGESVPVDAFISMQLKNILLSLTDLLNLTSTISGQIPTGDTCSLMGCPRLAFMTETVEESIRVLRESKRAFKSKVLGQLREKLEAALKQDPSKASSTLS